MVLLMWPKTTSEGNGLFQITVPITTHHFREARQEFKAGIWIQELSVCVGGGMQLSVSLILMIVPNSILIKTRDSVSHSELSPLTSQRSRHFPIDRAIGQSDLGNPLIEIHSSQMTFGCFKLKIKNTRIYTYYIYCDNNFTNTKGYFCQRRFTIFVYYIFFWWDFTSKVLKT